MMSNQTTVYTPIEVAQRLVEYIDSSGGDMNALCEAISSFEGLPEDIRLPDVEELRTDVESAESHLTISWNELEDGDDPLMSESYIGERDGLSRFHDMPEVERKILCIEDELDSAFHALDSAYNRVRDADTIPTEALDGDQGVYGELDAYIKFVRDEVGKMSMEAELMREGLR